RGLRQAPDCRDQAGAVDGSRLIEGSPLNQFCQRGSASHRRDAALGLKPDFRNAPAAGLYAEAKPVSTHRVFNFGDGVRSGKVAGMARVLEVVEQLLGIHFSIVTGSVVPSA